MLGKCSDVSMHRCFEGSRVSLAVLDVCGDRILVPISRSSPLGSFDLAFIEESLSGAIRGMDSDCRSNLVLARPENLYFVTSGLRSVTVVAEGSGGRVEYKIMRILGPSYEDKILKFLGERAPGLAPKYYCKASIEDSPVILVMEHVEGEPVTTKYLEAAVSSIRSGSVVKAGESASIGVIAATLHNVMMTCSQDWCAPERSSWPTFDSWIKRLEERSSTLRSYSGEYAGEGMLIAEASDALDDLAAKLRELENALVGRPLIRIHGDMHLYQFLVAGERIVLTDFEGEPFKDPASPLEKEPPERDLASLARSLDYVAVMAAMYHEKAGAEEASYSLPPIMGEGIVETFQDILDSYLATVNDELVGSHEAFKLSLSFWLVERASYEAVYELKAGTGLHHIPLNALLRFNEGKDPVYEWLKEA